jgi:glutamate/aspartate transport system permease protein
MDLDLSFYSWDLIGRYLLEGAQFSVQLTVVASVGGILFGSLLAVMRTARSHWIAWPAAVYVNTMRSVPLVMVILWFFLLMPFLLGRSIGAELSAYVTFVAFEAAFFCEIVRAGIQALPRGQLQAGLALGLSPAQNLRLVVLPQAMRNMLPVLLTQVIVLFQDTSLVYAIGAYDMLKGFDVAGKILGRPIEAYVGAAVIYFVLCLLLSRLAARLQRRVAIVR